MAGVNEGNEKEMLIPNLGQAGLNIGARLQSMGLTALIIDKNDRIGDNWRNRYRVSNSLR